MACGVIRPTPSPVTWDFRCWRTSSPRARSRAYGAYRTADGFSERALFLIDREGVIRWSYLSPVDVNPGVDGVLDALEDLPAAAGARS